MRHDDRHDRAQSTKRPAATKGRSAGSSLAGLTPCLWFDENAVEAAEFYVSVFPRSRTTKVHRSPADYPSGTKGNVLMVNFKLDGKSFNALNGGPYFRFDEAISFIVDC